MAGVAGLCLTGFGIGKKKTAKTLEQPTALAPQACADQQRGRDFVDTDAFSSPPVHGQIILEALSSHTCRYSGLPVQCRHPSSVFQFSFLDLVNSTTPVRSVVVSSPALVRHPVGSRHPWLLFVSSFFIQLYYRAFISCTKQPRCPGPALAALKKNTYSLDVRLIDAHCEHPGTELNQGLFLSVRLSPL